jgi:PKD domain/Secretion system C-terminal sorting domain
MRQFISIIFLLVFILHGALHAQSKRVLFLGNSYTAVNNLPLLLRNIALSTNDTLIIDSNTPGGYTLQLHTTNTTSQSKLMAGNWDFVVLQEQSQLPSFPDDQVAVEVFPYAKFLDSVINQYSPCAETVFYNTWGRKTGDASNCGSWPPVCSYEGMDSLLHLRYVQMATDNNALVSPVGVVWKYLRIMHPEIELYATDGSHPSAAGSYAAACSFYSVILRKNPVDITYNFGLTDTVARCIKEATKIVVYDSLSKWFVGNYDPVADIDYTMIDNTVSFQNLSSAADTYFWDFGDGATSTDFQPTHIYAMSGIYTLRFISRRCDYVDTVQTEINVTVLEQNQIVCFPNPVTTNFVVKTNSILTGKTYYLYNSTGQLVRKGALNTNSTVIQTMNLPSGMYVLKIEGIENNPVSILKNYQ